MITKGLLVLGSAIPALAGQLAERQSSPLSNCPGYRASNVQNLGSRVTADLSLAGTACNVYGDDLTNLKLEVEYQTGMSSRPVRPNPSMLIPIDRGPTSRKDL